MTDSPLRVCRTYTHAYPATHPFRGKQQMERGALTRIVFAPQSAAVRRDDRPANREPEPEPLGLCREERLEHAILTAPRQSDAAVRHRELHVLAADRRGLKPEAPVGLRR